VDAFRYAIALLLWVALPPALAFWLLLHPLLGFWRRLGPLPTYGLLGAPTAAEMAALYACRAPVLRGDLGTRPALVAGGVVLL
jgi:hypothetical protein